MAITETQKMIIELDVRFRGKAGYWFLRPCKCVFVENHLIACTYFDDDEGIVNLEITPELKSRVDEALDDYEHEVRAEMI